MIEKLTKPIRSLLPRARQISSVARLKPFETATPEGRSKERYRRIVLTTISTLLTRGVGMLASLATVALALAYLGKEQYGLYATITSLLAWIVVFNFGIVNGLVNAVSQAHGKNDDQAAGSYVSVAFFMLVIIAALLGAVFVLIAPFIPWSELLAVRGVVDDRVVAWSVGAAVIAVLVGMPLSIIPQVYAGYQKIYVANFFLLAGYLLTLLGVYAAVHLNASLPVLVLIFGGAMPIATLFNLIYISKFEMPWLRPRLSRFSLKAVKRLTDTSLPLFLFQVGALMVNQTTLVILAHRTDLKVVADYSIIWRLYMLLIGVIVLSTSSFIPSFRESYERGDHNWMRSSFKKLLYLRMLLAASSGLLVVFAGNWLLRIWLRQEAMSFGIEVWLALAVLLLSATWVTAFSDFLIIMDKIWGQVAFVSANGIITVLLTFWLSPSLGVLGVIVSVGFLTTVVWTWLLPLMARSTLGSERP